MRCVHESEGDVVMKLFIHRRWTDSNHQVVWVKWLPGFSKKRCSKRQKEQTPLGPRSGFLLTNDQIFMAFSKHFLIFLAKKCRMFDFSLAESQTWMILLQMHLMHVDARLELHFEHGDFLVSEPFPKTPNIFHLVSTDLSKTNFVKQEAITCFCSNISFFKRKKHEPAASSFPFLQKQPKKHKKTENQQKNTKKRKKNGRKPPEEPNTRRPGRISRICRSYNDGSTRRKRFVIWDAMVLWVFGFWWLFCGFFLVFDGFFVVLWVFSGFLVVVLWVKKMPGPLGTTGRWVYFSFNQ